MRKQLLVARALLSCSIAHSQSPPAVVDTAGDCPDLAQVSSVTETWRGEEGRVGFAFRGPFPSGGSESRVRGDGCYLKQGSTGEILVLEKR